MALEPFETRLLLSVTEPTNLLLSAPMAHAVSSSAPAAPSLPTGDDFEAGEFSGAAAWDLYSTGLADATPPDGAHQITDSVLAALANIVAQRDWIGHGQESDDGPNATAPRALDDVTPSGSPDGLVDRGIVDLAETGFSDLLLDNAI